MTCPTFRSLLLPHCRTPPLTFTPLPPSPPSPPSHHHLRNTIVAVRIPIQQTPPIFSSPDWRTMFAAVHDQRCRPNMVGRDDDVVADLVVRQWAVVVCGAGRRPRWMVHGCRRLGSMAGDWLQMSNLVQEANAKMFTFRPYPGR